MARTQSRYHRKRNSRQVTLLIIIICTLSIVAIARTTHRCSSPKPIDPSAMPASSELLHVVSQTPTNSRLIHYKGMDVSFNNELHIPNWVAWDLTANEADGLEPRYNRFMADPNIRESATPADYKLSGYDRGHMAPAGDMKWSEQSMVQSFYMTNICPQVHSLNAGPWKKLEEKCRLWARTDSVIYIVCGPVLSKTPDEYIGASKVAVPQQFFKVIISPYTNPPRGIGFIFNNGDNPGGMQKCARTIDQVETLTGYDFFSALPDTIENQLERQNELHKWPTHLK